MQGSGARANSSSAHLFVFTSAKAGMASVNQDAVNKVVYEMSKDSDYFKNEQRKAEEVSKKIEELRENMKKVPKSVYQSLETKYYADANRLRANQRFDRCWIHIDMDMFYAAVAIRDRPELVGKPVAVGGLSMISTANYEARSFGVRSAMPGFIAKQLCPELIFVPAEFEKYEDIASQIRKIFVVYDENFDAISLDEASLDITEYIKRNFSSELGSLDIFRIGEDIAQHIRKEIFEQTRLTSSAGISCNRMLAKICSDVNKPNGQKLLMGDHDEIQKFMEDLPVRKLPGVGKVTERILCEVGAESCGLIVEKLALLHGTVLTPKACSWLLERSLGIADCEREESSVERKSISTERTFKPISALIDLRKKCEEIAHLLSEDIRARGIEGRCVTLKLKEANFRLRQRSMTCPKFISSFEDLFHVTLKLLESELPVTVRLMGIKLSSLKDCSVIPIEKFFVRKKSSKSDSKITLMDNSIDDADEQESIGEFGIGEHESNSQSEHKSDSKITPMDNSIDDVDERDAIRESGNKEHESDSQSSRNSVKKIRSEAITIDEMFKSPGIQNASYCQSIRCPICDKKLSTSSLENDSHFETCGQSKKKRTLFDVFESTLLSGAPKITKLDSVCPVCERELHVTNLQLNLHIDKCLKKRETFENFFTFSKKTSTP